MSTEYPAAVQNKEYCETAGGITALEILGMLDFLLLGHFLNTALGFVLEDVQPDPSLNDPQAPVRKARRAWVTLLKEFAPIMGLDWWDLMYPFTVSPDRASAHLKPMEAQALARVPPEEEAKAMQEEVIKLVGAHHAQSLLRRTEAAWIALRASLSNASAPASSLHTAASSLHTATGEVDYMQNALNIVTRVQQSSPGKQAKAEIALLDQLKVHPTLLFLTKEDMDREEANKHCWMFTAEFLLGRMQPRFEQVRTITHEVDQQARTSSQMRCFTSVSASALQLLQRVASDADALLHTTATTDTADLSEFLDDTKLPRTPKNIRMFARREVAMRDVRWRILLPHQRMPLQAVTPDVHAPAEYGVNATRQILTEYIKECGTACPLTFGPYQHALTSGFNSHIAKNGRLINLVGAIDKQRQAVRVLCAPEGTPVTVWYRHNKPKITKKQPQDTAEGAHGPPSAETHTCVPADKHVLAGTGGGWMPRGYRLG